MTHYTLYMTHFNQCWKIWYGSKATPVGDIPADMLKSIVDIHIPFITKIINFSFENCCFPENLLQLAIFSKRTMD